MTTESQIAAWLATQQDAMVALLREMVDIDSGSRSTAIACARRSRGTGRRAMPAATSC